jgi:hypothetical protein
MVFFPFKDGSQVNEGTLYSVRSHGYITVWSLRCQADYIFETYISPTLFWHSRLVCGSHCINIFHKHPHQLISFAVYISLTRKSN